MSDEHFRITEFPTKSEFQWLHSILDEFYRNGGKEPVIRMETKENCHRVGIAARDWPGILEAVTGVYHEEGFNLHSLYADTLGKDREVAVLYAKITDLSEEEFQKLTEKEKDIQETLKLAAKGNLPIRKLIGIGATKVQIYRRLKNLLNTPEIRKKIKYPLTEEDFENITSEEGELFKFIFSRSSEYLRDRDDWTLINIILDSYWVQKQFLKDKTATHVAIHQFQTKRGEKLTGITVAGHSKVVDLGRVLQILYNIVPNLVLKFSKYFATRFGAQVVRVEVSTTDNEFLSDIQKKNIATNIKARISSLQRAESFLEQIGPGPEVYWRIIAPRIAEEAHVSGKPQMLLMLRSYDMISIIYDLLIAMPGRDLQTINSIIKAISEGKDHNLIMKVHSKDIKTLYQEGEPITVVHLRLNISPLSISSEKEIYTTIRKILEKYIKTGVRDFDEGLRNINVGKLERIMKIVRDHVPENDLKKIYYLYDEVLRLELDAEEIANEIKLAYELVRTFLENQDTVPRIHVISCREDFHCVYAIDYDIAVSYLLQPLTEEARKEFTDRFPGYHSVTTLEILGKTLNIVRFKSLEEAEKFAEALKEAGETLSKKRVEATSKETDHLPKV